MQALRIAASGMDAQQTRVSVISNNIANMTTTAYSARRADFADLHYQLIQEPGAISSSNGNVAPSGIELGLGVRTAAIKINLEQGSLRQTSGDLDIAIEGRGFFEVTLPSGEIAYTRDGSFQRNGEGLVVNADGYPLVGDITIPNEARSISINPNGELFAFFDGQPNPQLLGVINLTVFPNQGGLSAIGGNLYRQTEASGNPIPGEAGVEGRGTIRQGFLEESSVDVVQQIADLIEAQRGYELNSRVISAVDEMLQSTGQIR